MAIGEKTIDVEGLPVHYLESGTDNGRSMLLLHGGFGDARTIWQAVIPPLSEDYHVFALDLPGFGGSAVLPDLTIENLLHWLRAVLDALKQTDVVIVGSFIGALLVRVFAVTAPQYVPAVILINGGNIPGIPRWLPPLVRLPVVGTGAMEIFGRLTGSRRTLDSLIYSKDALTDELAASWRASAPGFARLMRAVLIYRFSDHTAPPVPTLILWGANDNFMPVAVAETLKKEIPGSVLSVLADCGHLPQLEASEAFVFQISSFLERVSNPTTPSLPGAGMLRSNQA